MSKYNEFLKYGKENHDEYTVQLALAALHAAHQYRVTVADTLAEIVFELENLKKLLIQGGLREDFILNITRTMEIRILQLEYSLDKFAIDMHDEKTKEIHDKFGDLTSEYERITHLSKVCVRTPDVHHHLNSREALERNVWLLNKEMESLMRDRQGQAETPQARSDIMTYTAVTEHYDITPAQIKEDLDKLVNTLEAEAAQMSTEELVSDRKHLLKKAALLKKNYAIFLGVLESKQNSAGKRFPQESISLFSQIGTDLAKGTDEIIHQTLDYNLNKEAFEALQLRVHGHTPTPPHAVTHLHQNEMPGGEPHKHRQRVHPARHQIATFSELHTTKNNGHKMHTSHLARDEELFRKEMAALQKEQKEAETKHKILSKHNHHDNKK